MNVNLQKSVVVVTFGLFVAAGINSYLHADANETSAPAADNTRMNKQDQSQAGSTADQASNAKSDTDLMRQIRRAVVQDKSLSVYAHNVKIIATQGKVVLKGTVHTEDEKAAIGAKAAAVAGSENVTNNILVKAS